MTFDPADDDEEELFPEITTSAKPHGGKPPPDDEQTVEKASKAARKLEPIVLAPVLAAKYQPVKPRVIAKQLDLPSEQHKALKLAIKRLAKAGKLTYGAGHLVRPIKPLAKSGDRKSPNPPDSIGWTGPTKTAGRSGPTKAAPPASPPKAESSSRDSKNIVIGRFRRTARGFGFVRPQGAKRGDKSTDIYIAAGATMDASDRDVVRVRLGRGQARGRGGMLRQAGEIVEIIERDTHRFVGVYKERGGASYVDVDGKVF